MSTTTTISTSQPEAATTFDLQRLRYYRHLKSGLFQPLNDPIHVTSMHVGVQAQSMLHACIQIYQRTDNEHWGFDSIKKNIQEGKLTRLYGVRYIMHLYDTRDWPLVAKAVRPKKSKRLRMTDEQFQVYIDATARVVKTRKRLTGDDLPLVGEDLIWLWSSVLNGLCLSGAACHGGESNERVMVSRETWCPDLEFNQPWSMLEANVELARRYFACFGPASEQDYRHWRGINTDSSGVIMNILQPELKKITIEGITAPLYILKKDFEHFAGLSVPNTTDWPVKLLGRYDSLLLAHKDKSWIVDNDHRNHVFKRLGIVEAVVLVGGQVAGTWSFKKGRHGLTITVDLFDPLTAAKKAAIIVEVERLAKHFFNQPLMDCLVNDEDVLRATLARYAQEANDDLVNTPALEKSPTASAKLATLAEKEESTTVQSETTQAQPAQVMAEAQSDKSPKEHPLAPPESDTESESESLRRRRMYGKI